MTQALPENVTGLLLAWSDGDQAALEKLIPLVYAELHRLAKRYMGREVAWSHPPDFRTGQRGLLTSDRRTPCALAEPYSLLRCLRPAYAAHPGRFRAGETEPQESGSACQVSLDEGLVVSPERGADLLALDEALKDSARLTRDRARWWSCATSAA